MTGKPREGLFVVPYFYVDEKRNKLRDVKRVALVRGKS